LNCSRPTEFDESRPIIKAAIQQNQQNGASVSDSEDDLDLPPQNMNRRTIAVDESDEDGESDG
jgi:hypothetical protein